jgi:hypothetical protein
VNNGGKYIIHWLFIYLCEKYIILKR